jgi:hypothetical protein
MPTPAAYPKKIFSQPRRLDELVVGARGDASLPGETVQCITGTPDSW